MTYVIIFEKEFGNDGSDITLGQILPVAKCHLIENNHVTYAGKLDVIFEGMVITTKLNTVLVKRFGRKEPRKRPKTSSESRVPATPIAEATEVAIHGDSKDANCSQKASFVGALRNGKI